jgi:hypothetical protein
VWTSNSKLMIMWTHLTERPPKAPGYERMLPTRV